MCLHPTSSLAHKSKSLTEYIKTADSEMDAKMKASGSQNRSLDRRSKGKRNIRVKSKSLRFLVFAVLLSAALTPPPMAQTAEAGSISGKLVDVNEAAIVGAEVTLINIATIQARGVTTDNHGAYRITLPPGNYKVRISATGFKTTKVRSITVKVGDALIAFPKMRSVSRTRLEGNRRASPSYR